MTTDDQYCFNFSLRKRTKIDFKVLVLSCSISNGLTFLNVIFYDQKIFSGLYGNNTYFLSVWSNKLVIIGIGLHFATQPHLDS